MKKTVVLIKLKRLTISSVLSIREVLKYDQAPAGEVMSNYGNGGKVEALPASHARKRVSRYSSYENGD
jgi:hypothetical protein